MLLKELSLSLRNYCLLTIHVGYNDGSKPSPERTKELWQIREMIGKCVTIGELLEVVMNPRPTVETPTLFTQMPAFIEWLKKQE